MREQIIQIIRDSLNDRNNFFLREEDIQLYLANKFILTELFDDVFIEYHVPSNLIAGYPWADINNIYVDIVLRHGQEFYPIEIKYKTVTQILPFNVFGHNINVALGQHGAQNIGCYDFWKDLKRVEILEQTFNQVSRGLTLFVSNDLSYQQAPLNPNAGYAPFSIHQGRHLAAGTFLNWNRDLAVANGRPGLTINYDYDIDWTGMQIPQHFYILT